MAESETRLETLEDEVKVLKGEVKRTLVDLRELLMREDSPLGQKVLTHSMSNGVAEVPDGTAAGLTSPGLEKVDSRTDEVSSTDSLPGPGLELPLDDLPSGPPQAGPGPIPGLLGGDSTVNQDDQPENANPMRDQLDDCNFQGAETLGELSNLHTALDTESLPKSEKEVHSDHSPNLNGRGRLDQGENEQVPETPVQNGRVHSVYDEYRELLEETKQTHPIEDEPVGPPLDINLLSNLVYWTALAKQRVGEEQLKDILQLYIQSGHSRPELQDLLLQVCKMVDDDPLSVRESPREWVDLMFHLHGILTGGFPVIKIPRIRLFTGDETKGEQG